MTTTLTPRPITPRQILQPARRSLKGRPTQEEFGKQLRIPHYADIERGKRIPHGKDLERIARELGLTSYAVWMLLWQSVYGPGSRPRPLEPGAGPTIADTYCGVIEKHPYPACIVGTNGALLAHNPPFARLVSGRVPANMIGWMLGIDSASIPESMPDGEETWVADGMARLQSALRCLPDDSSLQAIAQAARNAGLPPTTGCRPLPSKRLLVRDQVEGVVTFMETEVLYSEMRVMWMPWEPTDTDSATR